jgi:hypothetical protein
VASSKLIVSGHQRQKTGSRSQRAHPESGLHKRVNPLGARSAATADDAASRRLDSAIAFTVESRDG